jgi:hypothetical protein
MAATFPQEVFLSHSSMEAQFTNEVVEVLRRHRIPVWFSEVHILGAQQWQVEIGSALQRCDWFAIILSPQSVESMWVKRELSYALQQNRFDNRIVPITYQPADFEQLSWTLSTFQMVDFSASRDDGFRNLLRIWGVGYQRR